MLTDILDPSYYEAKDAETLAHTFHSSGLHNVGQLIKALYTRLTELEKQVEDLEEECNELEYRNTDGEKAAEFANWFLYEFEDTNIQIRTIRGKEFAIMLKEDLELAKKQFHNFCD